LKRLAGVGDLSMTTERKVLRTIARAVGVMVTYHKDGRTNPSFARMVAEVEMLAAWVIEEMQLPLSESETIIGPIEWELHARYGSELGARLADQFARAFQDASVRFRSAS
jgi:hypothetical protein